VKTLVAGVLAFVGACVVLALAGCTPGWRPATGTGKATVRYCELRRIVWPRIEARRLVIVDNPTAEDVIVDCDSARFRVPPRLATDVLLMPGDSHCDAHNDVEYGTGDSIPIPDVPIGAAIKRR
jgi:hypothetical protein